MINYDELVLATSHNEEMHGQTDIVDTPRGPRVRLTSTHLLGDLFAIKDVRIDVAYDFDRAQLRHLRRELRRLARDLRRAS